MPVVAFTFGSFGDITTILQLAWTLRRALSDACGASAQVCALVADIDAFTRALQSAKAALEQACSDGSEPALRNGITHALNECFVVLRNIQSRIDAYQSKISTAVGAAVWRKYWAASAWEILGGRRDVEVMKARLREQVEVIQLLLAASTARELARFAADAHAVHVRQQRTDDSVQTMLQMLRTIHELHAHPSTSTSPFVFFDKNGAQRMPVVSLPLAQFVHAVDIDNTVARTGGIRSTSYVTIMIGYWNDALHVNMYAVKGGHVLGDYETLEWWEKSTFRCVVGGFIHRSASGGTVHLSEVMRTESHGDEPQWLVDPRASSLLVAAFHSPSPTPNSCLDPWVCAWDSVAPRRSQATLPVFLFHTGLAIAPVLTSCVYHCV